MWTHLQYLRSKERLMPIPHDLTDAEKVVVNELARVREMRDAADRAVKVAETQSVALLYGETGSDWQRIAAVVGVGNDRVSKLIDESGVPRRHGRHRSRRADTQ